MRRYVVGGRAALVRNLLGRGAGRDVVGERAPLVRRDVVGRGTALVRYGRLGVGGRGVDVAVRAAPSARTAGYESRGRHCSGRERGESGDCEPAAAVALLS